MKGKLPLLILLGAAALLTVLLVLTSPKSPADGGGEEEETFVIVVDRDPKEIARIEYIYEGADPVSLIKTDVWQLQGQPDMPVNQTLLSTLANAMATVGAQRKVVDSSDDYAQYGLEEPRSSLTLTYTDGTSLTFYLGKEHTRLEGSCYMKTSGSDAVYLISSSMSSFFAYKWNELLKLDTMPSVKLASLQKITLTNPRSTGLVLSRDTAQSTGWLASYADGSAQARKESFAQELLTALTSASLTLPVDCSVKTPETLAQYGLDAESATAIKLLYTVTATPEAGESSSGATVTVEKTFTLLLGSPIPTQEGEKPCIYVMVESSSYVYRVESESLAPLLADFAPVAEESQAED